MERKILRNILHDQVQRHDITVHYGTSLLRLSPCGLAWQSDLAWGYKYHEQEVKIASIKLMSSNLSKTTMDLTRLEAELLAEEVKAMEQLRKK